MRRILVQSKIAGTMALMVIAAPLFAQSPPVPLIAPAPLATTPPASPLPPSAVALPALTLPSVTPPNPADIPLAPPSQAALPATTAAAPQASDGQAPADAAGGQPPPTVKTYSYGESNLSILFLPDQVNRMKEAIRTFEDTGKDAALPAPVVSVVAAPVVPEKIEDPLVYPAFYLASIAFEDPKDWTVWLSGYKITSRRNVTDVTVLSVTRDSATFLWKPSFMKAITQRNKDKLFAPSDPVKHKLVPSQAVQLDAAAGSVIFTLKPNQTFAPGYFKTFEGYIDGPTLTALPVVIPAPANAGQPGQPFGGELDANGNPIIDGSAAINNGASLAPPSTNFNRPAVPAN